MRPFQLSAVLVSAAMLLSGCYLGRSSVDQSEFEHTYSSAEVCEVSAIPMVAETVVSTLFLTVAVFGGVGLLGSSGGPHSVEDGMAQSFFAVVLVPIALIGGLLAADASAGKEALTDCAEAKEEWGIMKKMEAPRKRELKAPQPPVPAPQPPAPAPQPPEKAEEQPTPAPDSAAETPR